MLVALRIEPLHVQVVVVEEGEAELLRLLHLAGQVHELALHAARPEHALLDHLAGGDDGAGAERGAHGDEHGGDPEIAEAALRERARIELQRAGGEEGHTWNSARCGPVCGKFACVRPGAEAWMRLRASAGAPYFAALAPSCACTFFACCRWPSRVGTASVRSCFKSLFWAFGISAVFTASITAWWYCTSVSM